VSNGANIRRHKSAERLEYKGARKNICCAEQRRPAVGLYHVSSQKAHVQILTEPYIYISVRINPKERGRARRGRLTYRG